LFVISLMIFRASPKVSVEVNGLNGFFMIVIFC